MYGRITGARATLVVFQAFTFLGGVAGCAGASGAGGVQYVQAQPTAEAAVPTPPVVAMAGGPLAPGEAPARDDQIQRVPSRGEEAAELPAPDLIEQANRAALQEPETSGFFEAIQVYDFIPGRVYKIYSAPYRVTDIALRPGEEIVGNISAGDIVRWRIEPTTSVEGGQQQQHVVIKPTRPGLRTNMKIYTTQRTYHCELESYEDTYMAGVSWSYPQDDFKARLASANENSETRKNYTQVAGGGFENININYRIEVIEGEPRWKPTLVYDDGAKTVIRFPRSMQAREAPVLFLHKSGQTQMVNYRSKGGAYVIDRLIDAAELRLGQDDEAEVVRIVRLRGAR